MGRPYIVIGCDPKRVALAAVSVIPGEGFQVHTRTMPKDLPMACTKARQWMYNIVRRHAARHPDHDIFFYIEEPVVGRGGVRSTLAQAYIQGALLDGAHAAGATHIKQVNNSTLKKSVVGVGTASKSLMARHIKVHWPALHRQADGNQDVIDSGLLAMYGEQRVRIIQRMKTRRA